MTKSYPIPSVEETDEKLREIRRWRDEAGREDLRLPFDGLELTKPREGFGFSAKILEEPECSHCGLSRPKGKPCPSCHRR